MLPVRAEPALDKASIISVDPEDASEVHTRLLNIVADRKATIVRREDGFEKRIMLRCNRCNLVIGYRIEPTGLMDAPGRSDTVYLLPGGLMSTVDMKAGQIPQAPEWAGHENNM